MTTTERLKAIAKSPGAFRNEEGLNSFRAALNIPPAPEGFPFDPEQFSPAAQINEMATAFRRTLADRDAEIARLRRTIWQLDWMIGGLAFCGFAIAAILLLR